LHLEGFHLSYYMIFGGVSMIVLPSTLAQILYLR
jgi:hypothetical protein